MQPQKLKQNKLTFLEPPEWDEARTLGEEKEGKEDAVPGSPGRSPSSPHPTRQAPGCPRPCEALLATPSLPQVARNLAQLAPVWCWPESRPMGLRQADVPKQGTTRLFTELRAQLWICGWSQPLTPPWRRFILPAWCSPSAATPPVSMVPVSFRVPHPCKYGYSAHTVSCWSCALGGAGWSSGAVPESPQVP